MQALLEFSASMLPAAYNHPWWLMLLLSVVLAGASCTATAPYVSPAKKPMRPPFCKRKRSHSMRRARVITKRSLKSVACLALAVAKVSTQSVTTRWTHVCPVVRQCPLQASHTGVNACIGCRVLALLAVTACWFSKLCLTLLRHSLCSFYPA